MDTKEMTQKKQETCTQLIRYKSYCLYENVK